MKLNKLFFKIIPLILANNLLAAVQSNSYSTDGIYSTTINSSEINSNYPIINIASGKIFRLLLNSGYQNQTLPYGSGIIINNSNCSNVFIPDTWYVDDYYTTFSFHNPGLQDLTIAGPCKVGFTNSTGVSLIYTFQISSTPTANQTDF